ncbi:MAG: hypothetical protein OHK0017_03050 [Patescibacteria group bacterium]
MTNNSKQNILIKSSKSVVKSIAKSQSQERFQRKLVLSVSVFLLGKDNMKTDYWTISSVKFNAESGALSVGIKTLEGKAGTVLKNMRSNAAELAEYLRNQKLVNRIPKILFKVQKDDEKTYLESLNELIDSVEMDLKINID